ncbi:MAG: methyltransferase domain-containing protein [Bacteroidales bacterium]|nr:methyltransferase domain-containing protein [Bacteroidales bacterium]
MENGFSFKTLAPSADPMGAAIAEYFKTGKAAKLRVLSEMFDEDEIPVKTLFRTFSQMSRMEKLALEEARGSILDVGAGSGCHTLVLQDMGKDVCAIDISPLSVETMKARGVKDVMEVNLFSPMLERKFDTILMLMNGSGIIGKIENLPAFFRRMDVLLAEGGQILMDSSDLIYLYEEEDGSVSIDLAGAYYGEVDYRMQYRNIRGESFDWLYIDPETLTMYAAGCGYRTEILYRGDSYDFLARISRQ